MARPVHFEIHAADMDRAQAFYEALFGWQFQSWGDGSYRLIATGTDGPGIDGGLVQRRGDPPAPGQAVNAWVCTVDVADLDAQLETAQKHGATIARPRMAVSGIGWLAYIHDPEGNILGMLQADPSAA